MIKQTLTVHEAYDYLQSHGFAISYVKLRNGLISGQFKFGEVSTKQDKRGKTRYNFTVYKAWVDDYMREHGWDPKLKEAG